MRDEFIKAILKFAKEENIFFITADLGFGCFDSLEKLLGKRYINVGVCEQNMVNVASGLSLANKNNKIILYSIGNFPTLRCLEQIRNNICYHNLNVLIVSNGAGFSYGQLGMSHHATEDFGIMRCLPGLEIFTPCSKKDAYELTSIWIEDYSNPAYIRLDKSQCDLNNLPGVNKLNDFRIIKGKNNSILEVYCGGISSLLNNNLISNDCCLIYRIKKGISKKLVNLLNEYEEICIYEEHNLDGGFGQYISNHAVLNEKKQKITIIGINNEYPSFVGDQYFMRKKLGINKSD